MKTSTQLKALVRNLSKLKNVEAEILLRNFMLERFLERISISAYRHNFILKGGMLIAAMVGIDTRTIYILITTQTYSLDTFRAALKRTIEKRGTAEQMADVAKIIQTLSNSNSMIHLWQRYQKKFTYAAGVSWEMAMSAVSELARNLY